MRDGVEMEVPADSVMVGETVVVRQTQRIATDGLVLEGASAVDESMLTGESMPVEKQAGAKVISGTAQSHGRSASRRRVGAGSALAQIVKMVEDAQASSAPIQRIADGNALVCANHRRHRRAGLRRLVDRRQLPAGGCSPSSRCSSSPAPCALGIATPAALMVGVGRGAQAGIRSAAARFTEAQRLDTVVFDKTGMTRRAQRHRHCCRPGPGQVLCLAASHRGRIRTSAGRAIVRNAPGSPALRCRQSGVRLEGGPWRVRQYRRRGGAAGQPPPDARGVDITGVQPAMENARSRQQTAMLLASEGDLAAVIAVADTVKPEARDAVASRVPKIGW